MNPIDDMFRDGIGGRKGEVPADMWSRVSAGKGPVTPEGEGVDQYFAEALKDRAGDVPADMWNRIAAAGVPSSAGLDQVFADGLRDRQGEVPAGMWDRIWKARTTAPLFYARRIMAAVAVILLLLSFGWWALGDKGNEAASLPGNTALVASENTAAATVSENSGSAAGAMTVEEAGEEARLISEENNSSGTQIPLTERQETQAATTVTPEGSIDQPGTSNDNPPRSGFVPTTEMGLNDGLQSAAETLPSQPTNTPGEVFTDGASRTAAALPLLGNRSAIQALEFDDELAFKLKHPFEPQPLAANSFRNANRHRLQTEFLFGAFYANQQFSAETDDQRALRNIREVRENPGLSYQVSLRGAYKLNERLILRSGLTYSEIRNKFDFERTVNGVSSLVTINNQIRQLEVPILLGLRIPGRSINVALNAGPLVNLTTGVQGSFLQPDSAEPLSLADDGQYRNNVGIGFLTSLSTTYVIGKKQPFVLLVEPFFKAYPGSFTRKDAPLKEKYWAVGLQLGVRKGF